MMMSWSIEQCRAGLFRGVNLVHRDMVMMTNKYIRIDIPYQQE
jgi:hypothetical protein